jgi:hypothetical protein
MEYDGIAEVWLDTLEDWMEIVTDKAFTEVMPGKCSIVVVSRYG